MTRLAISNIAWSVEEAPAVYALLASEGVRGLEVAPALILPSEDDPFRPSAASVRRVRDELDAHDLQLVSMQSLLFGVEGAQLFGSPDERARFERGLERAIGLAATLGIPNLVLGSPANRAIPETMARAEAETLAVDVFHRLGEACRKAGTRLSLEPNPAAYGTNFLNTVDEAAAMARRVDHPAVTVNFDIGSLIMNGEASEAPALFRRHLDVVSHVHVSEPQLAPAPADAALFAAIASAVADAGYDGWVSIEMRRAGQDNLEGVARSVRLCLEHMIPEQVG